jgi:hypothetical protein
VLRDLKYIVEPDHEFLIFLNCCLSHYVTQAGFELIIALASGVLGITGSATTLSFECPLIKG